MASLASLRRELAELREQAALRGAAGDKPTLIGAGTLTLHTLWIARNIAMASLDAGEDPAPTDWAECRQAATEKLSVPPVAPPPPAWAPKREPPPPAPTEPTLDDRIDAAFRRLFPDGVNPL